MVLTPEFLFYGYIFWASIFVVSGLVIAVSRRKLCPSVILGVLLAGVFWFIAGLAVVDGISEEPKP